MPFSFEVRDTDLMGRVGVLRIKGREDVETPCLTPVIHPTSRDIPLSKFKELGFNALMTNSYIIYKRCREAALEKGLHTMLGFDGVLMTDSGGYQVLEYGDVDVTPSMIAELQSSMGSDLAVTLDRPTGYSLSRKYARETMEVSLRGAVETIEAYSSSETSWVGPIQGGLFGDLVKRSTRRLVEAGFQMLALGSPVELMDNYRFEELVRMIVNARKSMPYSLPLHLFGAGHPLTLPLSVALGCDTFDSASYILFAKQGRYMTERGTLILEQMNYLPCSCPVCNSTSRVELVQMESWERTIKLALHNLYLLRQDVLRCKQAIVEGRLWDLVEERAIVHPRVLKAFEEFAKNGKWFSLGTPFFKERGLLVRSEADLQRPELEMARSRLERIMKSRKRATKDAVLVSSDEERPLARTTVYHSLIASEKKEPKDIYRLHPILGPYPAELEFVYPFTQTVTEMRPDRKEVQRAARKLKKMGYSRVLVLRRVESKRARKVLGPSPALSTATQE